MTGLTVIAVLAGVGLWWIWRRFSNHERIVQAGRQVRAQIYAMRLYADDPALIFRAQGRLLLWTARYVVRMLPPVAVAVVPLFLLGLQLNDVYGYRAPGPGDSALVTVRFTSGANLELEGQGVAIETAGVRIPGGREVCWRVRDVSAVPGNLILHAGRTTITRAFRCGRRWWEPSPVIEVSCPAAPLGILGFRVPWPVWFLGVSGLTMLVLRSVVPYIV